MKKIFVFILLFLTVKFATFAQTPQILPTPQPTPPEDEVVVVRTNLVQVDAVVTDKDGKQVTDLKPEEFEIFQNGVKQQITNFSYVEVTPASSAAEIAVERPKPVDKLAPAVSTRLKPGQVRRTIALVVDDLGLSFESTYLVRQALKKFVDEQMQPNDLVAIVRTGGGIGALQQFSSDKRQLYAAIEKVRWNPIGRAGVSVFAPIQASPAEQMANQSGNASLQQNARQSRQTERNSDNFRSQTFVVGTLGAINYILTGMRELPGRKAVVLLSDGFSIFARDIDGNIDTNQNQLILDGLRRLTSAANRASVVINTIDARGLQAGGITAADDASGLNFEQLQQRLTDRRNELFDTQQGLQYLAAQTGGRSFINSNDIRSSVTKVLDDQAGYYLIGYQPDEKTFDPQQQQKFNKLEIKTVRPGLRVRYRSGFFGLTEPEEARPANQNPRQKLFAALTSPFGASGIDLRLNALFYNDQKNGSFITPLIHVNAGSLTFTDETDGNKKAVFDILAYTFGDNGIPIDQVNKTYTMQVRGDTYQQILNKGFVYYLNVPVKKPGAYQLRVAVRDVQGEKVGSANQFIEVPNLKKNRLSLSGIILQNLTSEQYKTIIKSEQLTEQEKKSLSESDPQTDTALRRFRRGTVLRFSCNIYNAKPVAANQLQAQTRIFKDGKLFYDGKPTPVETAGQTDLTQLNYSSAVTIPDKIEPGDYVLQVIVTDKSAKENRNVAAQTVEYEIVS